MTRSMTNAEKQRFRGYFPSLNVNRAVVTGNATRSYNCLAWTLGITNRWVWPGQNISDFDRLYGAYGFVRSSNGPIAAWGHSFSNMTHGCISGSGHGPRWESKCGSDLRIQHGLNELVGASYGRVKAFYRRRNALSLPDTSQLLATISGAKELSVMVLEKEDQEKLDDLIAKIDSSILKDFESRFQDWKKTWDEPHTAMLSNPSFVRYSKEFSLLTELGAVILPAVVKKLADPDNFFALQLYDALQEQELLIVGLEPDSDEIFDGEQGRAQKTVETWLRSN